MNSFYVSSPERRQAIYQATQVQIGKNRAFVCQYLSEHPCADCGESDVCVLEFDHVRGEKHGAISNMVRTGTSLETLKSEVEKCEVRCANCHRRKTRNTLW